MGLHIPNQVLLVNQAQPFLRNQVPYGIVYGPSDSQVPLSTRLEIADSVPPYPFLPARYYLPLLQFRLELKQLPSRRGYFLLQFRRETTLFLQKQEIAGQSQKAFLANVHQFRIWRFR